MELFGAGYVIDHCIVRLLQKKREKLYRTYITDGLKAISETLLNMSTHGGSALSVRWHDLDTPQEVEEERSADEIKERILSKLKGGDDDEPIQSVCEADA